MREGVFVKSVLSKHFAKGIRSSPLHVITRYLGSWHTKVVRYKNNLLVEFCKEIFFI